MSVAAVARVVAVEWALVRTADQVELARGDGTIATNGNPAFKMAATDVLEFGVGYEGGSQQAGEGERGSSEHGMSLVYEVWSPGRSAGARGSAE